MKSIYETLAALGAGAILLGGCAASTPPAANADVPAATETTPAAAKDSGNQETTGDAAPSEPSKSGNAAAMPADSSAPAMSAAPSTSAAPAMSGAPATSAAPKAAAPKTAKKPGTGKKKDAAAGCGEGTCG